MRTRQPNVLRAAGSFEPGRCWWLPLEPRDGQVDLGNASPAAVHRVARPSSEASDALPLLARSCHPSPVTVFYANLHFNEGSRGRKVEDVYRYAFYAGGRVAHRAVSRIRQGDTLYVRSTSKDDRPWIEPGFFGRATVLADPLPAQEARVLVDDQ